MATMATSQMHSTLNVPPPDDDMEISSDAGQLDHYDDIDIDLMDPQDDDQDIDYMLEDEQEQNHPDVQASGRDDVMVDDLEDTIVVEEDMRDDEPDVQLTDIPDTYDGLQFQDHSDLNTQEQNQTQGHTQIDVLENLTQVDDQVLSAPEIITTNFAEADSTDIQHTSSEAALPHEPSSQATVPAASTNAIEQVSLDHDKQDNDEAQEGDESVTAISEEASAPTVDSDEPALAEDSVDLSGSHEQPEQQTAELAAASLQEPTAPTDFHVHETEEISQPVHTDPTLDFETDNVHETEEIKAQSEDNVHETESQVHENGQSLKTDEASGREGEQSLAEESSWTYLHPVTVEYDGIRMSLFPPMDEDPSATYLLQDISVADKSIADLFVDCRHVLGESIKEEDELEISCEELDLCISEDSKHCTDTSLSQIVHVYVTLVHLDGVETPEPLLIYLTTKTRFSTQLATLFHAESEGKGLSQLQLRGSPSHDSINADDEPYVDAEDEEEREPEIQEQLLEGEDSTETKTADSSEQHPTNSDQIPENEEAAIDVYGLEPEAVDEGETGLEEYPEGHAEENEDHVLDPEEHLDDDDQENPESTLYQDAEQAHDAAETAPEESTAGHTADLEDGDVGSSGSSTVQGENDAFPTEAPNDSIPLSTISEAADQEENAPQSGDNVSAHENDATAPPAPPEDIINNRVEHTDDQATEEQTHDEYDEHAYDLEAVNQEWNPDEYEEEYNAEDADYDGLDYHEGDTSVAEESWEVLDNLTNSYSNNYATPLSPSKLPTTPGGLDQIPEEDEEEDSITYDDDLDEEQPGASEPQADASHARPTTSPLGKRSREVDTEGGGDDGSDEDPELKRLKSH